MVTVTDSNSNRVVVLFYQKGSYLPCWTRTNLIITNLVSSILKNLHTFLPHTLEWPNQFLFSLV